MAMAMAVACVGAETPRQGKGSLVWHVERSSGTPCGQALHHRRGAEAPLILRRSESDEAFGFSMKLSSLIDASARRGHWVCVPRAVGPWTIGLP
jgi:hypothetical protein